MTDDLILYTNPMSRGRIARWMLEETGQPYRVEVRAFDQLKRPEFLAVNPMGKVPAVVHRGAVVTETGAVCAYLADAFPEAGLAPATDDSARGLYYRWMFFAAGPLEAAVTANALGLLAPSDKSAMVGYGSFDQAVETLDYAVSQGGPWLLGDRFTAADVYVGSQVDWGLQFGTIPSRPAFEAYAAGLRERAGYKAAKAIDNALIAEMQAASPA